MDKSDIHIIPFHDSHYRIPILDPNIDSNELSPHSENSFHMTYDEDKTGKRNTPQPISIYNNIIDNSKTCHHSELSSMF